MTDNTFFDAPDDEPGQSRRSLLVLGAVGGALVLAAGGYFLLGGGGGSDSTSSQVIALPAARTPVVKVARPVDNKVVVIPAVSKVRLGRDPFLALYVPPVATPALAPGTTPTGGVATGTGGIGTTPTGGVDTPAAATPGSTPASTPATTPPAATKHRFSIFGITGSAASGRARVSIDGGAPFTIHEGSVFGPTKELTVTDIGLTVGVGEHVAFTVGEDPQPEMYAHESRLVP